MRKTIIIQFANFLIGILKLAKAFTFIPNLA